MRYLRRPWATPLLWGAIVCALGVRVVFWAYTQRVWEDALITFTPAENAASGLGLIHHAGDGAVHSFSSVISVLIPVVVDFVRPGTDLFAMRIASLIAVTISLCAAYRLSRDLGIAVVPTGFAVTYLSFDRWQVFFGMAGMETAIAVAVLMVTLVFLVRDRWVATGLMLGLCLLVRPEFVLMVFVGLIALIYRDWRKGIGSAVLATALVTPWILFSTLYYGSPIPQTILAKANAFLSAPPPLNQVTDLAHWFGGRLLIHSNIWTLFAPFREDSFVTSTPVPDAVLALLSGTLIGTAVLGAFAVRKEVRWMPLWGFPLLFLAYRILALPAGYSEWYLPPFTACVVLLAAVGMSKINLPTYQLGSALGLVLAFGFVGAVPFWMPLDRHVQLEVENRVRQPLGLYLASVVCTADHVGTESAGYIGYYSHARLYDFPGLTSSTVLDLLRHAPTDQRTLSYMIDKLRPEWLVLRPAEASDLASRYPKVLPAYHAERRFHHAVDLNNNGLVLKNVDVDFEVYRRFIPSTQACAGASANRTRDP